MNKTIEKLVGKDVTVTLHSTVPVLVKGKLTECDDIFLVVGQEKGEVVIPLTSVLHFCATPIRATKR